MRRRGRQLFAAATVTLMTGCTATGGSAPHPTAQETAIVITLTVGDASMPATLEDNAAARDFANQLPLTGQASDFNSSEKIVNLPGKLSTEGSPAGYDPESGDLAYYAPGGNLAIFYRDAPYAAGLVKLGRISGDTEVLAAQRGNFTIRIAAN